MALDIPWIALVVASVILPFPVLVMSDQAMPVCLSICLMNKTSPCSTGSLPALASCLQAECFANAAFSRYAMTYAPKKEYSCEQSDLPAHDSPSALLTITGLGRCKNSPYDFRSFVSLPGNGSSDAGLCQMEIYPRPDCVGISVNLSTTDLQDAKCVFQGGRSARLNCSPNKSLSAVSPYIQYVCDNSDDQYSTLDTNNTLSGGGGVPHNTTLSYLTEGYTAYTLYTMPPSTQSYINSSGPGPSGLALNQTLSQNGSFHPAGLAFPFNGSATTESKVQDASIAALVALIAAVALT